MASSSTEKAEVFGNFFSHYTHIGIS